MYRHENYEQLKLDLPFGVALNKDSRWVRLAGLIPWEEIDQEYREHFVSDDGQIAKPSRLAFGALYIQAAEGFTDEQTRRHIQENPYLQYFCGFESYSLESPFDASMMTYFRKRISADMVRKINEKAFCQQALALSDNAEDQEDEERTGEDAEEGLPNPQAAFVSLQKRQIGAASLRKTFEDESHLLRRNIYVGRTPRSHCGDSPCGRQLHILGRTDLQVSERLHGVGQTSGQNSFQDRQRVAAVPRIRAY